MFNVSLNAVLITLASAVLLAFLFQWTRKLPKPSLHFSLAEILPEKSKIGLLPDFLAFLALAFFFLAFIDPHIALKKQRKFQVAPVEGDAIYLALDRSGSMKQEVIERTKEGMRKYVSKLQTLKTITTQFIQDRPDDLLGIVAFARSAQVLTPLTLNHDEVLKQLEELNTVANPNEEGTAIGYAIFKTVNLIVATRHFAQEKEGYAIKDAIIVIVTDGFQEPSSLDRGNKLRTMGLEEAAQYAKDNNVKVYLINVEPEMAAEKFAPHRKLLTRITELTGGKFYMADNPDALKDVYKEINRLEKSKLPSEIIQTKRISFYPYLIAIGMIALFLSIFLDTTLLRKAP